ncbi:disease resistance response protein 206-like [Chenopodium quinoa]|uniref:disease resistance response protein 206-like n=1 Tax=Chenopodium quinoa TaxID=63459 RepID=UPI000B78B12D|nr:disease resistance response protein 206-like [Chenopodium quinoa]
MALIKSLTISLLFFFLFSLTNLSNALKNPQKTTQRPRKPCKRMVYYFHDVVYNGKNAKNATSAIVAAPAWGNRTIFAGQNRFGDVVVFDDPITLTNDFHSTPVGRAQGFYLYDKKDVFTSWFGFSFVFNSTEHKGSLNFAGANPSTNKARDISVIGGTGDFFMARGVATLVTDAFEDDVYFRLRTDVKLYECW